MAKRKPTKTGPLAPTRDATSVRPAIERGTIDLIMGARLARQLGISPVTFWRWRKMDGFPSGRRIRNHVYFSRADVLAWLDCQQQAA
jgi:predicted DNA-binding transcriptional regulator AlpA